MTVVPGSACKRRDLCVSAHNVGRTPGLVAQCWLTQACMRRDAQHGSGQLRVQSQTFRDLVDIAPVGAQRQAGQAQIGARYGSNGRTIVDVIARRE